MCLHYPINAHNPAMTHEATGKRLPLRHICCTNAIMNFHLKETDGPLGFSWLAPAVFLRSYCVSIQLYSFTLNHVILVWDTYDVCLSFDKTLSALNGFFFFFFFLLYSSAMKLFGCEPASMTHTSISANFHMMDSAARISGIKQIMVGLCGCFCSFVFFVFLQIITNARDTGTKNRLLRAGKMGRLQIAPHLPE